MRPLIGICANYSYDDRIGTEGGIGARGQEWQVLADDYVRSIERAGGTPVILPVTEKIESLSRVLSLLDGIILSGGTDIDPQYYGELPRYGLGAIVPERDRHEIALAKKVLYEMEIPVLGICRGCQLVNVASGGILYQDLQAERPEGFNHSGKPTAKYHASHTAHIRKESRLSAILGRDEISVNSFHHQAIKQVGNGFEVTMHAPDGLVEGIEMMGERFVVAVQWHPEMMIDHSSQCQTLFDAFVTECRVKEGSYAESR